MSSGEVLDDGVVGFSGDVSLEAANDFAFGESLFGSPFDIGPGRWIGAHPDHGDPPEGVVGLSVSSTVETVALLFA
jgi:hypothetical protein